MGRPETPNALAIARAEIAKLGDIVTLDQDEVLLETQRNANNGFAGLDAAGAINAVLQVRSGVAATINPLVLLEGELAIVTDFGGQAIELRVGDGITAGGAAITSELIVVTKTSNLTRTETTTYDADNELFISDLQPLAFYEYTLNFFGSATAGAVKVRLRLGSSNFAALYNGAYLITGGQAVGVNGEILMPVNAGIGSYRILSQGIFQMPAATTEVQVQWAQVVSSTTNTIANAGSILTLRRLR